MKSFPEMLIFALAFEVHLRELFLAEFIFSPVITFPDYAHPTNISLYKCFCFLFPMSRAVNSRVRTRTPDREAVPVPTAYSSPVRQKDVTTSYTHTTDLRLAKGELQSPNCCSLGTVSQQPQPETWRSPLCSANAKSGQDWSSSQKQFLIIHVHVKVSLFCRMSTYKLYQLISIFSICVTPAGTCQQLFPPCPPIQSRTL